MLWRNRELDSETMLFIASRRAEAYLVSVVNPIILFDIFDSLGQLICPKGIASV